MLIHKVNGVCGSGKTQAMIKFIAKHYGSGSKFVIAQPTIQLCHETAESFKERGINVRLITSDDQPGSTHQAYKGALSRAMKRDKGCVIITTHSTFLNADIDQQKRKLFNVFFDEVPQIDSTIALNLKHSGHAFIEKHFDVIPCVDNDELCDINIKVGDALNIEDYRQAGKQRTDLMYTDPALLQFLDAMLDKNKANYLNKAKWFQRESNNYQLAMHSILKPNAFGGWNSCRIMGANIEDSMMCLIWPGYGVTFKPDTTGEFALRADHDELMNRKISIHYFCERDWSKYARNAGGQDALDVLETAVNDLFGHEPSLVVANNDIQDFELHNSTRISNICHGINEHRDKHNILFMSALNDIPAHFGFMERWQGIDKTRLKRAKGMEIMYQSVMRTSLRDKASTADVKIVVPDINAANFLADMLPNVKLHAMDEICNAWGKPANKRGAPKKEQTKTNAECSKDSRDRKAACIKAHIDMARQIAQQYGTVGIPVTWQASTYTQKHDLTEGTAESWDEIRDLMQTASEVSYHKKDHNSLINFVRFKAGSTTKGKEDIEYVQGVQLDFDGGALTWIDASRLFSDIKHLTYNSYNNGKNNDAKYRIMVPFDSPVTCEHAELLWDVFVKRIESAGFAVGTKTGSGKQSGLDKSKRPANSFYYVASKAGKKEWSFFDTRYWGMPLFDVAHALAHWIPHVPAEYHDVAPVSNAGAKMQALQAALVKPSQYDVDAEAAKRQQSQIEQAVQQWQASQQQSGQGHDALFRFALRLLRAGLDKFEAKQVIIGNMFYARNRAERMRELDEQIASAAKMVRRG